MERRERLGEAAEARDWQKLIALNAGLCVDQDSLLGRIERQLDARDWSGAVATLRQLKFLEKFGEEIGAAEERMES
jgi:molecular chaperone HscB